MVVEVVVVVDETTAVAVLVEVVVLDTTVSWTVDGTFVTIEVVVTVDIYDC